MIKNDKYVYFNSRKGYEMFFKYTTIIEKEREVP